jgi:hypothetical protein
VWLWVNSRMIPVALPVLAGEWTTERHADKALRNCGVRVALASGPGA